MKAEHLEIIRKIALIERKQYTTKSLVSLVKMMFPEYRQLLDQAIEIEIAQAIYC